MERYDALKEAVGRADACELMSWAFAYPDETLAGGLVGCALADDARSCLADMGVAGSIIDSATAGLCAWADLPAPSVLADMRKTYSHLYLTPGETTPVFPYESAFLHVMRGAEGAPSLFRTSVTLDVERCMREAGVVAKNGRREPCDSVQEEFEFLSYLFAEQAEAIRIENNDLLVSLSEQIESFLQDHALVWLPSFMERTCDLTSGPYAAFASYASVVLAHLSARE